MFYESRRIARWWHTRVEKDGDVYDRISITYTNSNLMTYRVFKRTRVSVYDTEEYEYVIRNVPNVSFLNLFHRLNKYAGRHYTKRRAA
jgi:hypothetical protein